jgi:hypothetical protein
VGAHEVTTSPDQTKGPRCMSFALRPRAITRYLSAFAVTSLLLANVFAWTPSYASGYCDNTGCYQCDADGCFPL